MSESVEIQMFLNQNNTNPMAPDSAGVGNINGHRFGVCCWTRRTKDNTRVYHSLAFSEPFKKGVPRVALTEKNVKVYEFNKQNDEDPDFQSVEAFTLLGVNYWAAFWVDDEGASCPEDIRF